MTAQEQRIAIAESVGIKVIQGCLIEEGCDCWLKALPDYLNDLNAMHEVEKAITVQEWRRYSDKLKDAILESDLSIQNSHVEARYKTPHAAASQRAEAYLRTKQLWKD